MHLAITDFIFHYGYWAVAGAIALESMGLPVPGETTLIVAALAAGSTHQLDIGLVIAAAAGGAIVGDNIGYWVGREVGYWLLLRYGPKLGVTERQIKLGQYLFMRHGGKVVFFGRFFAVLRVLAAFLAGVNRMPVLPFVAYNVAGGVIWATFFGTVAYTLGTQLDRLQKPFGIAFAIGGAVALVATFWFLRRHQAELEDRAEAALPGPLRPVHLHKKADGKRCGH
jgi:Uncharacterized membrane-associated protein